ncbi:MAG: Na/Pi cotransporter family protein [Rhizobiales bacterium]|nr:Na/Pi cotransporter family protein [Hyphomicrobiales bacterium]NRB15482.1 Na/Pi cotransporter family protein [Hyphomicrobiales bacterium]
MQLSAIETLIYLPGSAALLLWGARMVRTGFMRAYGAQLRQGLTKNLSNRFVAAFTGFFAALVLQSSTAVAMLTTSFASAQLLPLTTGLAIMLGADFGAAIIAQLLSLNIKALWPLLLLIGYVLHNMYDKKFGNGKQIGRIFLGLGFILLSLTQLSIVAQQLQSSDLLLVILQTLQSEPVLAVIIAAILTYFTHSSLAVILLIAGFSTAGIINNDLIYPLVLGVNVGGALPALIMNLKEAATSKQIVLGNFLFRVTAAILGLAGQSIISPALTDMMAYINLGSLVEFTVFVHIMFNLALFIGFIGLTAPVAKLLQLMVKDTGQKTKDIEPNYLKPTALEMPEIALNLAARETLHLIDRVEKMLNLSFEALKQFDGIKRRDAKAIDKDIINLSRAIKDYLVELTQQQLDTKQSNRVVEIISFTTSLTHIGNELNKNTLQTIGQKIKQNKRFSAAGMLEITNMYEYIQVTLQLTVKVFMEQDIASARELIKRKELFRQTEYENRLQHLTRLKDGDIKSLETSAFHLDILRDLKRINSYLSSSAYPLLEAAGELQASRLTQSNSSD